ncbi:MAG: hypothetical protein IJH34_12050 [Romboutsia sp.]|nr:hypothetical protein [Romboutsia sp.]
MEQKSIREYLLSKGINAKQEKLKRRLSIEDESFEILIDIPLKNNLNSLPINTKEIFSLAYKCLDIIKHEDNFNIAYVPKNIVLKGKTENLAKSMFEVYIFDSFPYNNAKHNLKENCNISIVDTLDKVYLEKE